MESSLRMSILKSAVVVDRENVPKLLAALLEAAANGEGVYSPFPNATTLQDHLKYVWEWSAEVDGATGTVFSLLPDRDVVNRRAMEVMLNTFARFVKPLTPPCSITYRDVGFEEIYRYVLTGGSARKQRALLQFVDATQERYEWGGETLLRLSDEECYTTAQTVIDAWQDRTILSFIEEFYGRQAHSFSVSLLEKRGGYDVNAVQVYNELGVEMLPDLQLPYWQGVLADEPHFFEECAGEGGMLETMYHQLYTDNVYMERAISIEEMEGRRFLGKLNTLYPVLYQGEDIPQPRRARGV